MLFVSEPDNGLVDEREPDSCPCLSGESYRACCGRFHRGEAVAPTAVLLMRSRYAAFALGKADYLLATWHPSTRPRTLELDPAQRWYRLDVLGSTRGGMLDTEGTVDFRAWYRLDGRAAEHRETSSFRRTAGHWQYVDGV